MMSKHKSPSEFNENLGRGGTRFGDHGKLFIEVLNLVLKVEVLSGCFIQFL